MANKKLYLIANWKMQLNKSDSVRLAVEISKHLNTKTPFDSVQSRLKHPSAKFIPSEVEGLRAGLNTEIVLCPSFTALSDVARKIKINSQMSNVRCQMSDVKCQMSLGAQNVFYHEKGQYTGEVSPVQLKELGVEYVIVGHSERRQYLKETDEDVNRKIKICLENDLTPILCVGETFEERQIGKTDLVLIKQISSAMRDIKLSHNQSLLIAYEPVWVIGSGQAVEAKQAEHAAEVIRHTLRDFFELAIIKNNISMIYGGSVDAENILSFLKCENISGALVGGASLSSEEFLAIIEQVTNSHK